MSRVRVTQPVLVRSTTPEINSRIVRKSKRLIKRIEKHRAVGVFIKNAFGVKGRFVYIGT